MRYSAFGAWQVADHFNAEVVAGTIASKQDAIDYLTWTFFYRRLLQNPSYYNLESTEMEDVSEFLSDMVETTMATLQVCTFKRTMSFMPSFGSASPLEMLRIMPTTRRFSAQQSAALVDVEASAGPCCQVAIRSSASSGSPALQAVVLRTDAICFRVVNRSEAYLTYWNLLDTTTGCWVCGDWGGWGDWASDDGAGGQLLLPQIPDHGCPT